jgi:prepilin-type N-terminal cleavage/methylation domain-containing protein
MSAAPLNRQIERGFTLMEVMVAVFVISVGLLSAAAMTGSIIGGVKRSKYMSLSATLASEKLEELTHWPSDNPQVCIPTGAASVGSITADVLQTTTCASGASGSANYYDDVNVSLSGAGDCPGGTAGCFSETVSSLNAGATVYTTTYHSPDGSIQTTNSANPPGVTTLHRRWWIEANTPVTGTRRITVLVTFNDPTVQPSIAFQMSAVRP